MVLSGRRQGDFVKVDADIPTEALPRIASTPLSPDLLAGAECVVILTAHPGIDYEAVVASARLVFDAVGVTRRRRDDRVVLL